MIFISRTGLIWIDDRVFDCPGLVARINWNAIYISVSTAAFEQIMAGRYTAVTDVCVPRSAPSVIQWSLSGVGLGQPIISKLGYHAICISEANAERIIDESIY
jgi:hypothetical protein